VSLKTQVAKGLKWQAISIVGRQLLSFAVFTTLTRLLDPSAFGLVGLISVYLGLVSMFAEQGIGTALIQRQTLETAHLDTAFWFNFICSAVLCLGTIVFAHPIAAFLGDAELVSPLRWSSLVLILSALSTIHSTLFIKAMDFRRPTIRVLLSSAVGGTVGVGMAFAGHGVWALVLQQLTTAATGTIFLWSVSSYRPALKFSLPHLRDLFAVSSANFATNILWFITSRVDQLLIGRFTGASALGFYVIAGKMPEMAKVITHEPLAGIALPALSKVQNEPQRLCQAIYDGMELNATVSFAIFVGYAITAAQLIPLIFGEKWADASDVSSLLSLLGLINVLLVFCYPALLTTGEMKKYVAISVYQTLGALVACGIGVRFSVNWLVVGLIINNLIFAIPTLLFLQKRIGLQPGKFCQPCVVPAFASLAMAGACWLAAAALPAGLSLLLVLTCKILLGAVVYVGVMYIFKRTLLEKLFRMVQQAFAKANPTPATTPTTPVN